MGCFSITMRSKQLKDQTVNEDEADTTQIVEEWKKRPLKMLKSKLTSC
jgi:hypothetical protein